MPIQKLAMTLIQQYGYAGLMIALVLEFVFPLIPGESLMVFVGFQTWRGSMNYYHTILFAAAGNMLGSTGAYIIGKYLGRSFLYKYGKYVFLTPQRLAEAEKRFEKYQKLLYFFSRYLAGVRHVVPYLGGIYKIGYKPFFLYNLAGSLLWCISFITAGHVLGRGWKRLSGEIHKYTVGLLIALVLGVIAYKTVKALLQKNKKAAGSPLAPRKDSRD